MAEARQYSAGDHDGHGNNAVGAGGKQVSAQGTSTLSKLTFDAAVHPSGLKGYAVEVQFLCDQSGTTSPPVNFTPENLYKFITDLALTADFNVECDSGTVKIWEPEADRVVNKRAELKARFYGDVNLNLTKVESRMLEELTRVALENEDLKS